MEFAVMFWMMVSMDGVWNAQRITSLKILSETSFLPLIASLCNKSFEEGINEFAIVENVAPEVSVGNYLLHLI